MSTITWCLPSGLGVSMSGMFVCRCPPLPSLLLLRSYYASCHHRTNSPVGRYRTHGQHPRSHRPTPARPLVWYHKHFYFWCFHLTLLVNIYQSMCFVCEMWDWIWLKNSKKCAIFNVGCVDWSNSLWNNGMKYGQSPKSNKGPIPSSLSSRDNLGIYETSDNSFNITFILRSLASMPKFASLPF